MQQIVHIKYVQVFVYQLCLIKLLEKKKENKLKSFCWPPLQTGRKLWAAAARPGMWLLYDPTEAGEGRQISGPQHRKAICGQIAGVCASKGHSVDLDRAGRQLGF